MEKDQRAWDLATKISAGEITIQEAMIQVIEEITILEASEPATDKDVIVIRKCRKELMLTVTKLLRETRDPAAIVTAISSVVATMAAMSTNPEEVVKGIHEGAVQKLDTPERKALTEVMRHLLNEMLKKKAETH